MTDLGMVEAPIFSPSFLAYGMPGMPRKMVKRWVPQPTAEVSNECLGRCVSDVNFLR